MLCFPFEFFCSDLVLKMTGGFIVFWEVVGYCLFWAGQGGGLAMSYGMWYLSSLTTDRTHAPCTGSAES